MTRLKLSPKKYIELKKYILERDCFCLKCGTPYNLTPAHVIRRSQGGDDSKSNMICLCIKCHDKFDQYKIELPIEVYTMLSKEG